MTTPFYGNPRFGYGLTVQQSHADVLDPSYPYITNIVETVFLGDEELVLARVDPPFEFSELVQPLKISDCSGPSNPAIGTTLSIFGLGLLENGSFPETMQVKCVEAIEGFTAFICDILGYNSGSVCIQLGACPSDEGGPIVVEDGGDLYLAAITLFADCGKWLIDTLPSIFC